MQAVLEIPACVSIEAAGARLGRSRPTIQRMILDGELVVVRPNLRYMLVTVESIERYEAGKVEKGVEE
jgi:hypothetical protein